MSPEDASANSNTNRDGTSRHPAAVKRKAEFNLATVRRSLTEAGQRTALGVRREKAALSSGCKSHPATAPAGSNRSSHGGDKMAEAFGIAGHELVAARVCRPQRE